MIYFTMMKVQYRMFEWQVIKELQKTLKEATVAQSIYYCGIPYNTRKTTKNHRVAGIPTGIWAGNLTKTTVPNVITR